MKFTVFYLLAFLCPAMIVAQPKSNIRPLKIGDPFPDITFNNAIYHPEPTIKLSDYKGKLVILDFWSSWCGSCIQLFPYMDSLQKQFPDDLQIILVNGKSVASGDDEKKIRKIIDKVGTRIGHPLSLPVTFNNPALDEYFPRLYIPHEVWLDTNGVVLGITSGEDVTAANIQAYLEGKPLALRLKQDQPDFDVNSPLFVNGNGGAGDNFIARAVIAPYTEGLKASIGQVNTDLTSRLYALNHPFSTLLQMAYPAAMAIPANRRFVQGAKAIQLLSDNPSSLNEQLFCYDLVMPVTTEKRMYAALREDLERTFNLQVLIQRKTLECWVMTKSASSSRSNTKGGESEWDFDKFSTHKFIRNKTVEDVVQVLNTFLPIPLVNETGLKTRIDLDLPDNLQNPASIIKALEHAGFRVEKKTRTLATATIIIK